VELGRSLATAELRCTAVGAGLGQKLSKKHSLQLELRRQRAGLRADPSVHLQAYRPAPVALLASGLECVQFVRALHCTALHCTALPGRACTVLSQCASSQSPTESTLPQHKLHRFRATNATSRNGRNLRPIRMSRAETMILSATPMRGHLDTQRQQLPQQHHHTHLTMTAAAVQCYTPLSRFHCRRDRWICRAHPSPSPCG